MLSYSNRIGFAAIEATRGTAEAISNSDTAFRMINPRYENATEFTEIAAQEVGGFNKAELNLEVGRLTFDVYARQSAAWGPILLPACGFHNGGSGTNWSPTDDFDQWETLTIGCNISGKKYTIRGAMGEFGVTFEAARSGMLSFTFTGALVAEADVSQYTPAYTQAADLAPARFAGATVTLNSVNTGISNLGMQFSRNPQPLLDAAASGGYAYTWLDRNYRATSTIDPLETLVATRDDAALMAAMTKHALSVAIGSMSFAMPKAQRIALTDGERNGLSARNIELLATEEVGDTFGSGFAIDLNTAD